MHKRDLLAIAKFFLFCLVLKLRRLYQMKPSIDAHSLWFGSKV